MLSVLQGILLIVLALFALGLARFVFSVGHGLVAGASMALLGVRRWVRWIILLPAIVLSAYLLIITFNVIFWIGGWFEESFVGTGWMWGTTFIQAVVIPNMLVTTSSVIAPNARRWIAIAVMLMIWVWLAGTLLDPDIADFLVTEGSAWFYGWLVVAAGAAAYAAIKAWAMDPVLRLAELEMRGDLDGEMSAYCPNCGAKPKESDHFCAMCGVALGRA